MPDDVRDNVHVGYLPVPPLDRLMELRDALVALKGPLASETALQEDVRRRLFNEEADTRVLGEINTPLPSVICSIPFG
ncbi:type VI secretion system contractile sheath small subunit [Pseudomonas rhodesiae]|uniref:type VI secretion system contractile sheath small subunit n=1 Tax=Pseudomonas rhodesiae TaxID=76760 RepID=UPI003D6CA09D